MFKHICINIYVYTIIYLKYMYKQDLVLNNQQCLICHKNKPN